MLMRQLPARSNQLQLIALTNFRHARGNVGRGEHANLHSLDGLEVTIAVHAEGLAASNAHLFLHLPGSAPNEPGRATARRILAAQPVGSLPQLSPEAERWLPVLRSVVETQGVPTCWRGSWVREAGRSLVSDSSATPRPEREAEGR